VSVFPVMLDGRKFTALVVGGGAVALRKAAALLDGGVAVTILAPEVHPELEALAGRDKRLTVVAGKYELSSIAGNSIVVAATDDPDCNAKIASDALRLNRLVNVADAPAAGNFATTAVHRAGDLTVAVSAGGLPGAAAAIRDSLAERFDHRYAEALASVRELRSNLLAQGRRDDWRRISSELFDGGFCEMVENGLPADASTVAKIAEPDPAGARIV
jgi:siroheme synthase-like protein